MNDVRVLKPGFYTSIQDLGRFGFRSYGVPVSGVMDSISAKKANLLLNNDLSAAVLEITMTGPELEFSADTQIAICGAEFDLQLNTASIRNDKVYAVTAGDILRFGGLKQGFRAYLAISGGLCTEQVLNSRSQYVGLTSQNRLFKGDILAFSNSDKPLKSGARVNFETIGIFDSNIEVYPGPEFDLLPAILQKRLFQDSFSLSPSSNRMAIGFKELIPNSLKGITTSPVTPGTVQLTPGGNLITLMRDCQVTGGYPRVLQLSELGICTLAQKRPGEHVEFILKEF